MVDVRLKRYCEEQILPRYAAFDRGHRSDHIAEVVEGALELAQRFNLDCNMIYAAALFHDLGLAEGRELHHMASGRMAREDLFLAEFFTEEQREIIAQAIEDHRASNPNEPRSEYGRVISSADRKIDVDTIIMRAYYYRSASVAELGLSVVIDEIYHHISVKYGPSGYVKIPILTASNARNLEALRNLIADPSRFKSYCERLILESGR